LKADRPLNAKEIAPYDNRARESSEAEDEDIRSTGEGTEQHARKRPRRAKRRRHSGFTKAVSGVKEGRLQPDRGKEMKKTSKTTKKEVGKRRTTNRKKKSFHRGNKGKIKKGDRPPRAKRGIVAYHGM